MSDLISRQDVLDEIRRFSGYLDDDMITRIYIGLNRLPSTQPEIIHCRECKHWKTDHPTANGYHCCHRIHNAFPMREDDFCSRAERRENEEKNRRTNQSIH